MLAFFFFNVVTDNNPKHAAELGTAQHSAYLSQNIYSIRLMETYFGGVCFGVLFLVAAWICWRTKHRSFNLLLVTAGIGMMFFGTVLVHRGIKYEQPMDIAWGGGVSLLGRLIVIVIAASNALYILQAHELWWDVRHQTDVAILDQVSVWRVRFASLRRFGRRGREVNDERS